MQMARILLPLHALKTLHVLLPVTFLGVVPWNTRRRAACVIGTAPVGRTQELEIVSGLAAPAQVSTFPSQRFVTKNWFLGEVLLTTQVLLELHMFVEQVS